MDKLIKLQSFISKDTFLKIDTFFNPLKMTWETHSTYKSNDTLYMKYKTKKLHFKRIEYFIKIYELTEITN